MFNIRKLFVKRNAPPPIPPWIVELGRVGGWHEVRDKKKLMDWLGSDGRLLGDPSQIAWCGDAMETAILRTLPEEPVVSDTGGNPYWARSWRGFGVPCKFVLGAMMVMKRGNGGHITTLIGLSPDGKRFMGRGGNQSNMIRDSWFDLDRVIAKRWPKTYPVAYQRPAPILNEQGKVIGRRTHA